MTIVASIDFSAATDRVFETAAALAESLHGRVVLLHVVQPAAAPKTGDSYFVVALTIALFGHAMHKAREEMASLARLHHRIMPAIFDLQCRSACTA